MAQLFVLGRNKEKKVVTQLFKWAWKKMCNLPRNTSNDVLRLFIGDPHQRVLDIYRISEHKAEKYVEGRPIDTIYLEPLRWKSRWKHAPPKLTLIVSLMYGKKDKTYGLLMTRHNLGLNYNYDIDIERILTDYQSPQSKTSSRIKVK